MTLLDLPSELRIIIYKYFLPKNNVSEFDVLGDHQPTLPGLLTVSKQLHAETAPIFFAANSIKILGRAKLSTFDRIPAEVARAACLTATSFKHLKNVRTQIWINRELIFTEHQCDCPKIHVGFEATLHNGVLGGNSFQFGDDCHCGSAAMPDQLSQQCAAVYSALQQAMDKVGEDKEANLPLYHAVYNWSVSTRKLR
jgi:hypothetical protein